MLSLMIKCIYVLIIIFFRFPLLLEAHRHHHRRYKFVVREASYTRLCEEKKILTVNGKFPGPTIKVHKGETIVVDVYNKGKYNISLHWHGVKQPRNPWADGPEYVTQCPIQAGAKFTQKVIFSDEEGTLWWHAHAQWARASVHGAIMVYPKRGTPYPFPRPHHQVPIILGEWWKEDITQVLREFVASGDQPRVSDAYTINGQPGDLYPCSQQDTFKLRVRHRKTYLLRIINADLNEILFVGIANHSLTVVGADGSYTKHLTVPYVTISPGQTLDCLLHANISIPGQRYYMAARPYVNATGIAFDNSTATAIVEYICTRTLSSSRPPFPLLPNYTDTWAATNFNSRLRSLNSRSHPSKVPLKVKKRIVSTVSLNAIPCPNTTCQGPNGTRLAASMNNITFVNPSVDILEAYYYRIKGVFGKKFPKFPPSEFNYTADLLLPELQVSKFGTQVRVVKFNSSVELVFQGTNVVTGIDHPMHLHGYNFYVVGSGFGNWDKIRDPLRYNLVDPPLRNTVAVPRSGWTAVRFRANNPGVWFLHCHLERHLTWGMKTVFIVTNGKRPAGRLLPPPPDMPPC